MPRPHEIRTKPYRVISREVPPLRRKTGVIPALPPRMWRIPNIYPATYLFVDSPYTIHKQITLPHTAPSFPYLRNRFPSMPAIPIFPNLKQGFLNDLLRLLHVSGNPENNPEKVILQRQYLCRKFVCSHTFLSIRRAKPEKGCRF